MKRNDQTLTRVDMWFTRLWFEYAPLYNKFRTVSMSLTVLQVTLPMLGFYVLDRILKGKYEKKAVMKALYIAFGITAGFCALSAFAPGIAGTFTGAADAGMNEMIVDALAADREALLVKDALRSLLFVTCAFLLIIWTYRSPKAEALKGRTGVASIAIILLVLLDLIPIGKRYLNNDHFVTPKDFTAQYELRPVDEMIMQDPDLDYRVLDLSVNTFNSAIPSYHHKTIGGYSPVKLQRYQDLIERYITPEIRSIYDVVGKSETIQEVSANLPELKVISMLNGKYIVLGGDYSPVVNPHAMGNAWFVEDFMCATDPDEEIALLASADLRNTAVIGDDFAWARPYCAAKDSTSMDERRTAHIEMTYYAPNELRYSFSTGSERAAIFSEIYYPKGWKAWIEPAGTYGSVVDGRYQPTAEGRKIDLFRADWMLRGAVIPEGEGQLIMRFEPDSYRIGENISRGSSIALIVLLLLSSAGLIVTSRSRKVVR